MSDAESLLVTLPSLRATIEAHDLMPTRALGQNFLLDRNITDKIVRHAGDVGEGTVFEIGPGPGGLTRSLLAGGAGRIIALEKDRRCLTALAALEQVFPERLRIIEADALEASLPALPEASPPFTIVANLPYNIATPLLFGWLAEAPRYRRMVLMFQKEVADRILASAGGKAYGRLSVMAQYLCDCGRAFDIPPQAFFPPPKVTSTVVVLVPKQGLPADIEPARLAAIAKAAFGNRRKMLRSSLKTLTGERTEALLDQAGIAPTRRAEELSIEEFTRLARLHRELGFPAPPSRW